MLPPFPPPTELAQYLKQGQIQGEMSGGYNPH